MRAAGVVERVKRLDHVSLAFNVGKQDCVGADIGDRLDVFDAPGRIEVVYPNDFLAPAESALQDGVDDLVA